jgi:hypothetical protein
MASPTFTVECLCAEWVESFPTVSIRRGDAVLFHGVLLPHHEHLARLLEKLIV